MTEAERLAERLLDLVSNFTKPSYRETLTDSAALLRSQAEELERLRAEIVALEQITADVQAHGQKGWSKAFQALGDVK